MVKTQKSEINLIITLIFAVVGLLPFFITPSYSLGWQDKEWVKLGCPETVSGNWTIENSANTDLKSLSVKGKEVIYTFKNGQARKFQIVKFSSILNLTNSGFV